MFNVTTITENTEETKFFPSQAAAVEFAENKMQWTDVVACWVTNMKETVWDMRDVT